MVEKEYNDLRELLVIASACKKPDQMQLGKLLETLQKDIEAVTHAKETNRKDRDWFNHLATVAAGATAVGWVAAVSRPRSTHFKPHRMSPDAYAAC